MSFITNFFKFNNSEKNKINKVIKELLKEYNEDLNMIYIIELYNKESSNITKDIELINNGRKELISEINKIKDKEFGIYQALLNDLVYYLLENYIDKNILEMYDNESIKITNNINLIDKYRNILIVKLNENN